MALLRLIHRLALLLAVSAFLPALADSTAAAAPSANGGTSAARDDAVRAAFLYGYPYYEFLWLRDQAMHNAQALTYTRLNEIRHQRHLTTPTDRWANGPIRDTLYSTAWLDLAGGPALIDLPDTDDRYYVVVLIGADTDSFQYLGRRSTGTRARKVAVVGPNWQGPVPEADQVVRSPTRDVYLNMRVLVRDDADLPKANALQDRFRIQAAAMDPAREPRVRPREPDVGAMLDVINEALARNPPPAREAPLLDRYRAVGLCAGCRWQDLSRDLQDAWRRIAPAVRTRLKSALEASRRDRPRVNGWLPFRLPHSFGDNYALRAGSAANSGGIFGLEAAEATYFMGLTDAADEPLGDGRGYRLHLPAGGLPADAFWSVSLYEFEPGAPGQYMLPNAIDRYLIADRTPGLIRNADGSLDIWLQPQMPTLAEQRANWLPTPATNRFYLNARIYQPRPEVLDPTWAMPAIQRWP
ncbi:MAG: DUF1254 domain-containing protein [Rhodocyclaceae bacterium]|nr:DUF1254 domain-containing protein [Rhodocyclaceae bacterium]